VTDAIDKLSRVAVLLDLIAVEEQLEPRPLTSSIDRIADDSRYGLYTILCQLHVVFNAATSLVDVGDLHARHQTAINAASQLTLTNEQRPASRHIRAYTILYDFKQLLMHLTVRFNNLHRVL
jgi:hypothetical protein